MVTEQDKRDVIMEIVAKREPRTENRVAFIAALLMDRKPDLLPNVAARTASAMASIASALHTLAEHDCNVGLTSRQENRRENLQSDLLTLARYCELDAKFSGDPRGAAARLTDPNDDSAGDGFAGGWGIYR